MIQQNFLSPTGFRFSIKRLPNVSFFVQAATIPGLTMGVTESPTPFKTIHFAGDKIQYDQFNVTVRVDEYMDSYNEIFDWMIGLTKPESFDQYRLLKDSDDSLYSDATLVVLNSRKNPALEVTFKDMFPVSIGAIELDTTESDVNYKTCDITFQHNGHSIKRYS